MLLSNLFKVSQSDRNKFSTCIIDSSAPNADFYFLVILSTLIVALGLLNDNVILVIGGMLVTPLLSPILAISLGIVINNSKVIRRSIKIFLTAFILACLVSFVLGIFDMTDIKKITLINRMQPSLFAFCVAIIAGLAASYTWVKPNLNNTLPGVAITVTLIPPLTAVGLALAKGDWIILRNTFLVLVLNITGIILASIFVFSLMDFYKAKKKIIDEVKEEERELKKS